MTENIYHYPVNLPTDVDASVMPCLDGYTVYTNNRLTFERRIEAFKHELEKHIAGNDLESEESVNQIEARAHK